MCNKCSSYPDKKYLEELLKEIIPNEQYSIKPISVYNFPSANNHVFFDASEKKFYLNVVETHRTGFEVLFTNSSALLIPEVKNAIGLP